ncbi:MAG: hypothetical protein H7X83_08655 [Verrucomicrobia bacterium]|nr:hypothetical protein [Deltaproteobacteria bacterium]
MSGKLITINFCGGCNPKINRGHIAKRIQGQLTELGYEVSYNAVAGDLVICLSGCSVSCAERNRCSETGAIVVAGSKIESITIEENALVDEILLKVRTHFEDTQTDYSLSL